MVVFVLKSLVEIVRHHPKGGVSDRLPRSSESDVLLVFLVVVSSKSTGEMANFPRVLPFIHGYTFRPICTEPYVRFPNL